MQPTMMMLPMQMQMAMVPGGAMQMVPGGAVQMATDGAMMVPGGAMQMVCFGPNAVGLGGHQAQMMQMAPLYNVDVAGTVSAVAAPPQPRANEATLLPSHQMIVPAGQQQQQPNMMVNVVQYQPQVQPVQQIASPQSAHLDCHCAAPAQQVDSHPGKRVRVGTTNATDGNAHGGTSTSTERGAKRAASATLATAAASRGAGWIVCHPGSGTGQQRASPQEQQQQQQQHILPRSSHDLVPMAMPAQFGANMFAMQPQPMGPAPIAVASGRGLGTGAVAPAATADGITGKPGPRAGPKAIKAATRPHARQARVLNNSKVFPCTFDGCPETFARPSQLRKHVYVHTGERPFLCTVCTQSFRTKWTLKKHTRTHTGEKPFSCEDCSLSFTQRGSWRRHVFASHRKEVETRMDCEMFRCTRCSKCYKIKQNLERHLATHKQHDDDDGNTGSATSRPPTATSQAASIREQIEITPPFSPGSSSLRQKGVSALLSLSAMIS